MHEDELWQVYAPNGEAIPGSSWDSALDNPEKTGSDVIVGVAVVFLYRRNSKGVLELLWQKRSEKVSRYPGDYDISAGGHINLGETVVEGAIRECHEEIGVEISAEDLGFVTMRPFNKNRFAWVFAVDFTGREEDFKFNDEEVSEVRWVAFPETEKFKKEFAKVPLKDDEATFAALENWFRMRGLIVEDNDSEARKKLRNYAFIDGNNLYLGAKYQDIKLDYKAFRLYLKNRFNVERAFLFIGKDKENASLYERLRKCGFDLVFKPTVYFNQNGKRMMKENVDAELVLYCAAIEHDNYDKAVVVTGDGDFACLMKYLVEEGKLLKIIAPASNYSLLLKPYTSYILRLSDIKGSVSFKNINKSTGLAVNISDTNQAGTVAGIRGRSKP